MTSPYILHMITPQKHMSPFDVNMALDAGWNAVIPYSGVALDEVRPLVQDAIFSRPPSDGPRTGLFIGGRNAIQALDMIEEARHAMAPPFELSVFADPSGSFTTAAAMAACVEKLLKDRFGRTLKDLVVAVYGGAGVVSFSSAVIAALRGAKVRLVGHDGDMRVKRAAREMYARFGIEAEGVDGSDHEKRGAIAREADIVFSAGPAGVRILASEQLEAAPRLTIAADVNAAPPSGVEGVNMLDNGAQITSKGALGVGPLAIGNVKYQTESGLFRKMIAAGKAVAFDFRDAYALASEIVNK
jgi:methylene-tetrahydromethanopterin dehydrogenase